MVQAERLAAVGQTIAMLSHHIKNILQGIRGGSYLIEQGLAKHDENVVRKGWNIVERNQGKISTLVMDMLTFSKEREPDPVPGDLNQVVGDVVELMQSRAAELEVAVEWQAGRNMPTLVFDPEGIHRAVLEHRHQRHRRLRREVRRQGHDRHALSAPTKPWSGSSSRTTASASRPKTSTRSSRCSSPTRGTRHGARPAGQPEDRPRARRPDSGHQHARQRQPVRHRVACRHRRRRSRRGPGDGRQHGAAGEGRRISGKPPIGGARLQSPRRAPRQSEFQLTLSWSTGAGTLWPREVNQASIRGSRPRCKSSLREVSNRDPQAAKNGEGSCRGRAVGFEPTCNSAKNDKLPCACDECPEAWRCTAIASNGSNWRYMTWNCNDSLRAGPSCPNLLEARLWH